MNKAKALLRRVNGSNAILVQSAENLSSLKGVLSQQAAELAALQEGQAKSTQSVLAQIKQLETKLDEIAAGHADSKTKIDRLLNNQGRIIKPSHDIRTQIALQEIRANGFWFVDIPRTSSTSVRVELGQQFGPAYAKANVMEKDFGTDQYVGDHVTAKQMSRLMGAKPFKDLLSFTIVRNPWARAYSFYSYRLRTNSLPQDWGFTEYCQRLTDLELHAKFCKHPPHSVKLVAHLCSTMADHLCDDAGKLLVNRVIRFENRHKELAALGEEIDCPNLGGLHVQRTATPDLDYRTHYTPETEKLIGDHYADDVNLFGYEF